MVANERPTGASSPSLVSLIRLEPKPRRYFHDDTATVWRGNCVTVMRRLPDNSIDSIVTDPPYGLEFMGKDWDAPWLQAGINKDAGFGSVEMSDGAVRLPRPTFTSSTNPNCLNCGGKNRGRRDGTALVAVCVCDAPRFPNGRAVEMAAFQEWCEVWARECLRVLKPGGHMLAFGGSRTWHRLASAVEDAGFEIRDSIAWLYGSGFPKSRNLDGDWQGWGTALKPAFEPIVVGRKPFRGTVAGNVLVHDTGALNIDGCRIEAFDDQLAQKYASVQNAGVRANSVYGSDSRSRAGSAPHDAGRWPTNVVLDGDQAEVLDEQTGVSRSRIGKPRGAAAGDGWGMTATGAEYDDQGGASRFFPVFRFEAKAPAVERPKVAGVAHPTVKPLAMMRWLCRLVTPPGGTVLDPFGGSGTTAEAALNEGFHPVLIEQSEEFLPLIMARINRTTRGFDFGSAV